MLAGNTYSTARRKEMEVSKSKHKHKNKPRTLTFITTFLKFLTLHLLDNFPVIQARVDRGKLCLRKPWLHKQSRLIPETGKKNILIPLLHHSKYLEQNCFIMQKKLKRKLMHIQNNIIAKMEKKVVFFQILTVSSPINSVTIANDVTSIMEHPKPRKIVGAKIISLVSMLWK